MAFQTRQDKSGWELTRERCRLSELEPSKGGAESTAQQVIKAVFATLDSPERQLFGEIVKIWETVSGPQIAVHARPAMLSNAVLTVHVDSAVWLNELTRYSRAKILEKLQQRFGRERIKSINLQPDPDRQVKA